MLDPFENETVHLKGLSVSKYTNLHNPSPLLFFLTATREAITVLTLVV